MWATGEFPAVDASTPYVTLICSPIFINVGEIPEILRQDVFATEFKSTMEPETKPMSVSVEPSHFLR